MTNVIIATVILLSLFGVIVSSIGYYKFNEILTDRYEDSAYYTAVTTTQFVSGEYVDYFLQSYDEYVAEYGEYLGPDFDETSYAQQKREIYESVTLTISDLCENQGVSLIYVIVPLKEKDYKTYVSVVNCPSKATGYTPWELGSLHEQKTEEYWNIYRDILDGKIEKASVFRNTDLNGADPYVNSLIPSKRLDGSVAGIIIVQQPMKSLQSWRLSYTLMIGLATLIVMLVSLAGYSFIVRRQFVKPIQTIKNEAQRFSKENSAPEIKLSDNISKIAEISDLAQAIGDMEIATLEYIDSLSKAISEQQKLGAELDIARQIQESSLPSTFPAFPLRKEFDLFASMRPAKQVGGDFYDFFLVDDDHLAMIIADVSGKGVPAALFMMVTKILINEGAMTGATPAAIFEFINDRICARNQAEMFVTIWFGILKISTGEIIASNAGHDNPAVLRNGRFEFVKEKRGVVIGAMSGMKYKNFELKLEKGDKIFLYTDGVPEATDEKHKMLGLPATLEALNELSHGSPKEIIDGINARVDAFMGDAPRFDDTTMLCLSYFGKDDEKKDTLTVSASTANLPAVNDFIEGFLSDADASPKALNQLLIAVEEVFVNVAHYAYPPDEGKVEIELRYDKDKKLVLTFSDSGVPYDPLKAKEPDVTLPADEREEGGLGIYMTKRLVDEVTYEHKDGRNVLTLVKSIH